MAFSQLIKRGQAPATCILCEEETKIKWKCLSCDMLMCTKCKEKIHVKFKFAKDHKIVDIKEIGDHLDETNLPELICERHPDQTCVLFCTTCDRLVCTSCITKLHNGHGFVEISEGFNIKMEKFKKECQKAKAKIDELVKRKQEMSHVHKENNAKYEEVIQKICVREIDLRYQIDRFVGELKDELNRKWNEFQKEEIHKVNKVITNLQDMRSNAKCIIQSKDAEQVFIECEKLSRAVSSADNGLGTILFLPGQISPYTVGSLQVVSEVLDVRMVKQFQTDISDVFDISLCPNNYVWISDGEQLQKVKLIEHKLTVESTLKIKIFDMAITPTGDLLLSSVGGRILKQISGKTGDLIDSIYNVEHLSITAVHVTKLGEVIVGARRRGKSNKDKGRRAIIVINENGKLETIYEYDKYNIRIFTNPVRLTSTDKGNICVVDELSKDSGRVVVLNRDGVILQIYTGHPEMNSENKPFIPWDVVTTPSDNIIVTDITINIFHILNSCGQLIKHYNVGDIGIKRCYSLCFTMIDEQLYIGCTTTVGSSEKGKIYEVKISGC